jgi:hypothetical protein
MKRPDIPFSKYAVIASAILIRALLTDRLYFRFRVL